MKTTLAILLLVLLSAPAAAQSPAIDGQRAEMKKLDWWIGHWRGEGWYDIGQGRKMQVHVDETIQSKLGGLALLVEGLGRLKEADGSEGRVVHQAMATITYDDAAKVYRFASATADGKYGELQLKAIDGGYQWGRQDPQGRGFRYTIRVTPAGEWHEIGERSADGKAWQQFHSMTLKKVQ